MLIPRFIPVLLLSDTGLVKTSRFKKPVYLGDAINVLKIFNAKEVDEVVILDIHATAQKRGPRFDLLTDIASECFMPAAYGGGIHTLTDIEKIFKIGFEKVIINSAACSNIQLIKQASDRFGSQSIVGAVDVKKTFFGKYQVVYKNASLSYRKGYIDHIKDLEMAGVGEVFLQSVDRDGTMGGYDIDLVKSVSESIDVPLVACGGAGNFDDMVSVIKKGKAHAAAAGSYFVFHGKTRGILISAPGFEKTVTAFGLHDLVLQ